MLALPPPAAASAQPRVDSWGVLAPSETCACDCAGCTVCLDACLPLSARLMAPTLLMVDSSREIWDGEVKPALTGPVKGMDENEPLARGSACVRACTQLHSHHWQRHRQSWAMQAPHAAWAGEQLLLHTGTTSSTWSSCTPPHPLLVKLSQSLLPIDLKALAAHQQLCQLFPQLAH